MAIKPSLLLVAGLLAAAQAAPRGSTFQDIQAAVENALATPSASGPAPPARPSAAPDSSLPPLATPSPGPVTPSDAERPWDLLTKYLSAQVAAHAPSPTLSPSPSAASVSGVFATDAPDQDRPWDHLTRWLSAQAAAHAATASAPASSAAQPTAAASSFTWPISGVFPTEAAAPDRPWDALTKWLSAHAGPASATQPASAAPATQSSSATPSVAAAAPPLPNRPGDTAAQHGPAVEHAAAADAAAEPASSSSPAPTAPTATPTPSASTDQTEPCAQISKLVQGSNSQGAKVPMDIAEACLHSIPIDNDVAADFVVELKKYAQFESTLAFLKNPPANWFNDATDTMGGLDRISWMARLGQYKNLFNFEKDLYALVANASEAHFAYTPCTVRIFGYASPLDLVSISADGLDDPSASTLSIWTRGDAEFLASGAKGVSAIQSINGQDPANLVQAMSSRSKCFDANARYNNMFYNPAYNVKKASADAGGVFGSWMAGTSPIYRSFDVTYVNGTRHDYAVAAYLQMENFSAQDGTDLFNQYCAHEPPKAARLRRDEQQHQQPQPAPSLYPEPEMRQSENYVLGYYLDDDKETQDVAVLQIPSFEFPNASSEQIFSQTTSFLRNAKSDGKTKLIIDVSANPGGYAMNAQLIYSILFPSSTPYGAVRWRAHEAMAYLTRAASSLSHELYNHIESTHGDQELLIYSTSIDGAVTPDQEHHFASWSDLYGPHEIDGDAYSNLFADWNNTAQGLVALPDAPDLFPADNILLVTDGQCHSTCAIFTSMLKNIQGVRSVVFGGVMDGSLMQATGGTKGRQSLNLKKEVPWIRNTFNSFLSKFPHVLTATEIRRANETLPLPADQLAYPNFEFSVNYLNGYAPGDHDLPVQFIYEAADCRLFYTAHMMIHPEQTWIHAAKATWGSGVCAKGSTNGQGSVSAGGAAEWENPWFNSVYGARPSRFTEAS